MKYGKIGFAEKTVMARDIIIATGSVPFVPPGIEIDGKYHLFLSSRVGFFLLDAAFKDHSN